MPDSPDQTRAIIAAILYASWFTKRGLQGAANDKDAMMKEYLDMLRRVESAVVF